MKDNTKDKGIEEIEYRPGQGKGSENNDGKMIEGGRIGRDMEGGRRKNEWDDEGICIPGFWTARMKCAIGCGTTVFLVLLFSILFGCSIHKIEEGL